MKGRQAEVPTASIVGSVEEGIFYGLLKKPA
jgi:hypothetical protein